MLTTFDDLKNAIEEILSTLGVDPEGVYADVRARLDLLEIKVNNASGGGGGSSSLLDNPFFVGTEISVEAGAGAPSSSANDGSLYIRTDGTTYQGLYQMRSGVWQEVLSGSFAAGGDLSGDETSQTIEKIQGNTIDITTPTTNDVISYDGTKFINQSLPDASTSQKGLIQLGGDLSGNATSQTVTKIQNKEISTATPNDGEVLIWNNLDSKWTPGPQTASGGGGPVVIEFLSAKESNIGLNSEVPLAVAHTVLDIDDYSSYTGDISIIAKKVGTTDGYVIIQNLTDNTIAVKMLITSTNYTEYTGLGYGIGLASGSKMYEVRIYVSSTAAETDGIICTQVSWKGVPV